METIKVIDISKKGKKEKLALRFPPNFIEKNNWQKVRRVYFSAQSSSSSFMLYAVRTKTNKERVNKLVLPKGSEIKLDPEFKYRGKTYRK
ncbi:MAG: hypothetical protein ACK5NA_10235 [Enterococcus sp.]